MTGQEHSDAGDSNTRRLVVGWLVDGSGRPARRQMAVDICGDRITQVKPLQTATVPTDDHVLDLSDHTLLPALIDCHVHLTLSGRIDPAVRKHQVNARQDQADQAIGRHLTAHRRCGILAVRDGGDRHGFALDYKTRIRSGGTPQVHLAAAGHAWHASGRYGRLIGRCPKTGQRLDEAIGPTLAAIDHVKIIQSGINSLTRFGAPTAPQFDVDQLAAAVNCAHQRRRPVMAHANGSVPVAQCIEAGCDSIEHGFFMGNDNLYRLADAGIFWVPTAVTMAAYAATATGSDAEGARRILDHQLEQIRTARQAGVAIAVGTDAGSPGVDHGSALLWEMRLLAQAGWSLEQVVAAATANGARLLRLSDRGQVREGMRADLIAVAGPPEGLLDRLADERRICVGGKWAPPVDQQMQTGRVEK